MLLLISSCNSDREKVNRTYNFDYDYELRSYSFDDLDNHTGIRFYLNGQIIRSIYKESGCKKYYYNSTGKIKESTWSRNCSYTGRRTIFIYDSLNNHIGHYNTMDSVINFDTIAIDQTNFYNSNNKLIKERINKGVDIYGKKFEIWRHYTYSDSLIKSEITLDNNDTVWVGNYFYNSKNNLTKIHRTRNNVYETELFKYNINGLLIEQEIISTKNPVTPTTSHSAGNNTTTYEYDSNGTLIATTILNHKGEISSKTIYKKVEKQKTTP